MVKTDYLSIVKILGAVLTGMFRILKYFEYRSRQDGLRLVTKDFHAVVATLPSGVLIERMAESSCCDAFTMRTRKAAKAHHT